jgi:hypothetical protein
MLKADGSFSMRHRVDGVVDPELVRSFQPSAISSQLSPFSSPIQRRPENKLKAES